jgi:allantoate deiminase
MPRLSPAARELVRRIEELGKVSDAADNLTRTFLSPAMRRANALVGSWMLEAGLRVHEDAVGNLIGRLPGPSRASPTLLLGSHLDTVRDAGRFDGAFGVVLPILALAELRRRGITLPFSVEVLGFSDEEGVRFPVSCLGSKGYAGRLRRADLAQRDADGIQLREILEGISGQPFALPKPAHSRRVLLGYVEVHLEQGPVLETLGHSLGVVSAIVGQTRVLLTFTGRAAHAGTTPMPLRRDALAGAAEFIVAVEGFARRTRSAAATVGSLMVRPGAANVIAGKASLTLDVRHADDAGAAAACGQLERTARRIAKRRALELAWHTGSPLPATACDRVLTAALAKSVRTTQPVVPRLLSWAGHDGMVLSSITPIAMLFVRCRGGLSHHPDEFVAPRDVDAALKVLIDFLIHFKERP